MDNHEKAILSVIVKKGKVRYNELKKIIVDELNVVSDRPFREKLNQLVKNRTVFRIVIDKQNVIYTADPKLSQIEKSMTVYHEAILSGYEEGIDNLKKKINDLSDDVEKADLLILFIKSISLLHFLFSHVDNVTSIMRKRLEKLESSINLILKNYESDINKRNLIGRMLFSEHASTAFEFESKLYGAEKFSSDIIK